MSTACSRLMLRPLARLLAPLALALVTFGPAPTQALSPAEQDFQDARSLYHAGSWEAARDAFIAVYEKSPEQSRIKAEAAVEWASLLWEQGDYAEAGRRAQDALDRARKLKIDKGLGRYMLIHAQVDMARGQLARAEKTFGICVKMAGEEQDPVHQALCRMNYNQVQILLGKAPFNEAQLRADAAQLAQSANPLVVGASMARSSDIHLERGEWPQALALLEQAHARFEQADSIPAQTRNRVRMAEVLLQMGQPARAQSMLKGVVTRLGEMRNRPLLAQALNLEARLAQAGGNLATARERLHEGLRVAQQTASPQLVARAQLALCEFAVAQPQSLAPAEPCAQAAKGFERVGSPALGARALATLARHHHQRGENAQAQPLYAQSLETLQKLPKGSQQPREMALLLANLCQVEASMQATGAQMRCRQSIKSVQALSTAEQAGLGSGTRLRLHLAAAISAQRDGNQAEFLSQLEKAAQLAGELGPQDPQLAAEAYLRLGAAQATSPARLGQASETLEKARKLLANQRDAAAQALHRQVLTQLAQAQLGLKDWQGAQSTLTTLLDQAKGAQDHANAAWACQALAKAALELGDRKAMRGALQDGIDQAEKAGDAALAQSMRQNLDKLASKP